MATTRSNDDLRQSADEMFAEDRMNTAIFQPTVDTSAAFTETDKLIANSNLIHDEDLNSYFARMKKEAAEEVDVE
ncbi:type II toxin-antitoxin system antitoxin, RelB/DinJ family [Enterococcus nangangensis]|uniref:type II toxin-antitoxin system antitoxin, RelB/DinJ family n=1 Tax=Enterococcus nangangensis TaxID=2559926 RepID=UPI0010F89C4C|nr:type II toxin-antitoxin system antitoxin, RelB/DinJ family [Enterococcus nangangensis]